MDKAVTREIAVGRGKQQIHVVLAETVIAYILVAIEQYVNTLPPMKFVAITPLEPKQQIGDYPYTAK